MSIGFYQGKTFSKPNYENRKRIGGIRKRMALVNKLTGRTSNEIEGIKK